MGAGAAWPPGSTPGPGPPWCTPGPGPPWCTPQGQGPPGATPGPGLPWCTPGRAACPTSLPFRGANTRSGCGAPLGDSCSQGQRVEDSGNGCFEACLQAPRLLTAAV